MPDECQQDCNGNMIADLCDIANGNSFDCNGNGVLDECDVAGGTSEDCDGDEVPDDCQSLFFVDTSPTLGPIGDGIMLDDPQVCVGSRQGDPHRVSSP